MGRDNAGTYTLAAGNPVSPNTTISSTWANSTLTDLANGLTNSLSRTGLGAMQAPLRIKDGISGAPGLTFDAETTSGFYRADDGIIGLSLLGVNYLTAGDGEILVPKVLHGTNGLTITQSASNTAGATITGNGTAVGAVITGGSSAGTGLLVTAGAGNGTGASIAGTGTGYGLSVNGAIGVVSTGTTNEGIAGIGAAGQAGIKARAGTAATATTAQTALYCEDGYLGFRTSALGTAVNPNKDVGFSNTLTPLNITKMWARIVTGASTVISEGFNIASVGYDAFGRIELTFATAMGTNTYCAVAMSSTAEDIINVQAQTTTVLTLNATNRTATINLQTAPARTLYVLVLGSQ